MEYNRYDDQEELEFYPEDVEISSDDFDVAEEVPIYEERDAYDPIEDMLLHEAQQPFDLSELDGAEEVTETSAEEIPTEEFLSEDLTSEEMPEAHRAAGRRGQYCLRRRGGRGTA